MDDAAAEALARMAENVPVVTNDVLNLLLQVLPRLNGRRAAHLAARSLYEGLGREFGVSREATGI
jgi:hypothetical protein